MAHFKQFSRLCTLFSSSYNAYVPPPNLGMEFSIIVLTKLVVARNFNFKAFNIIRVLSNILQNGFQKIERQSGFYLFFQKFKNNRNRKNFKAKTKIPLSSCVRVIKCALQLLRGLLLTVIHVTHLHTTCN